MTLSATPRSRQRSSLASARQPYPPVMIIILALVNLVPFFGLLPWIDRASSGMVSGFSLLPVLVLPTALAAARWDRRWYTAQLLIASVVCFAVIGAGPFSTSSRLVGAVTTVGTLVFVVLVVVNGRRRVDIDLQRLTMSSSTDPLTGVLNRRGFEDAAPSLIARARAARLPIGIAAFDLDHFKRINDTSGHDVGDAVLARVAELAREVIGDAGEIVRSGGEEFLVVTVGDIREVIDALRRRLAESHSAPPVTISVGLLSADPDDLADLDGMWSAIDRADQWLYLAKADGRDRIADGGQYHRAQGELARVDDHPDDDDEGTPPTAVFRARFDDHVALADGSVALTDDHDGAAIDAAGVTPGAESGSARHVSAPRSVSRWQAIASRSRDQRIDARTRLLYQLIVVWMVMVGMLSTMQQALTDGGGLAATAGLFAVGAFVGVVTIFWIWQMTNAWTFAPLAALAAPFEMVVVFTLPVEMRPPALMLVLLAAFLVVTHWAGTPMVVQVVIVAVSCIGAAARPGVPFGWIAVMVAVTAAPLIAVVLLVGAIRSEQEGIEDELRRLARTDPLTELGNRRALDDAAEQWASGELVMVDIDHFKSLNDRYGHTVGDLVLRSLADTLTRLSAAPRGGVAFRIGGDEFVIAGPELGSRALVGLLDGALPGLPVPVTVTAGAASWSGSSRGGLWGALLEADRRLLDTKQARQQD